MNPEARGEYRLTDKMAGLRPTTVLKHINKYQAESRSASRKTTRKRRATRSNPQVVRIIQPELFSNEPTFETIIIALKERIRKEVMAEFYDLASK